MPRRRCSRCGERLKGKPANGYVSYYVGDDRTTFYTSWSVGCFRDDIYPVIERSNANDSRDIPCCVLCGEAIEGDPEQIFLTLFPPKREQVDYEFAVCPSGCFETLRVELAKGGTFRPDRTRRDGAQAQAPSTDDVWAGMDL